MTKTIIQGLVISKMDYCNSLLGGMYSYNMKKLQCIQNVAARIIFCQSKYCHITPLLKELHWLQITEWIDYKITVIVFCCRKGLAPNYLSTMIVKSHNRPLRSTTNYNLPVNKFNTTFVNNRSFKALGPRIWNNLPDRLRNIEDINILKLNLKPFSSGEATCNHYSSLTHISTFTILTPNLTLFLYHFIVFLFLCHFMYMLNAYNMT